MTLRVSNEYAFIDVVYRQRLPVLMALSLCVGLDAGLYAQGVASRTVSIGVSVQVEHDARGWYRYEYRLTNSRSSNGSIWFVALDIARDADGVQLTDLGLVNGPRYYANSSDAVLREFGSEIVRVGVDSPPGWFAGVGQSRSVEWSAPDETPLVGPGDTLAGFRLESYGLPGFRSLRAEGEVNYDALPIRPPVDPTDLDRYRAELDAYVAQGSALVSTIGPTAPPADAQVLLKRIAAYGERASQYGWIRPGIGRSLQAKMGRALGALARGDSKTAVNVLNALLNEVKAQAGKGLSAEAVALIRFNTEYLLRNLDVLPGKPHVINP